MNSPDIYIYIYTYRDRNIDVTLLKEEGVGNPSYKMIRREVVVALVLVVMLVGLLVVVIAPVFFLVFLVREFELQCKGGGGGLCVAPPLLFNHHQCVPKCAWAILVPTRPACTLIQLISDYDLRLHT